MKTKVIKAREKFSVHLFFFFLKDKIIWYINSINCFFLKLVLHTTGFCERRYFKLVGVLAPNICTNYPLLGKDVILRFFFKLPIVNVSQVVRLFLSCCKCDTQKAAQSFHHWGHSCALCTYSLWPVHRYWYCLGAAPWALPQPCFSFPQSCFLTILLSLFQEHR